MTTREANSSFYTMWFFENYDRFHYCGFGVSFEMYCMGGEL